jgi:tRNA dimethylallyltransferase
MLQEGLLEEIRELLSAYPEFSSTACQAIGYKEFIPYLDGSISLNEAADMVKQATRNYAKRQLTWFRKIDSLIWIENKNSSQVVEIILDHRKNPNSMQ